MLDGGCFRPLSAINLGDAGQPCARPDRRWPRFAGRRAEESRRVVMAPPAGSTKPTPELGAGRLPVGSRVRRRYRGRSELWDGESGAGKGRGGNKGMCGGSLGGHGGGPSVQSGMGGGRYTRGSRRFYWVKLTRSWPVGAAERAGSPLAMAW